MKSPLLALALVFGCTSTPIPTASTRALGSGSTRADRPASPGPAGNTTAAPPSAPTPPSAPSAPEEGPCDRLPWGLAQQGKAVARGTTAYLAFEAAIKDQDSGCLVYFQGIGHDGATACLAIVPANGSAQMLPAPTGKLTDFTSNGCAGLRVQTLSADFNGVALVVPVTVTTD